MQLNQSTRMTSPLMRGLAAGALALLLLVGRGDAQEPAPVAPTVPIPKPTAIGTVKVKTLQPNGNAQPNHEAVEIPELSLGDCIAIAIERQPSLKAVRASQGATSAGYNALSNIGRLGSLLSPDLPIRKEQSTRGMIAAASDVQKLHNEVVHDVTRLYYTTVYARQQAQIAEDVVAQVELLVKIAEDLLKSPQPGEMTRAKLDSMQIGLADAKILLLTARLGEKRAYAALREIMNVQNPPYEFRTKDTELPVMEQMVPLTREMVVELATCRRPELALAAAGADAFRLEVYAQGQIPFRRSVPTLASGSDIHSRMLPPGSRDPGHDYRPEPILPEMPPQLVGNKSDRVTRAMWYSQRADAVYEKIRNLVTLEAENTFYNLELAAQSLNLGQEKFDRAKDLMKRIEETVQDPKSSKDQLVVGYAQAARAQADYVKLVYEHLLWLAALERVTAGGVRPAFPGR